MAKLMDKASAMKLKDGGKGTTRITDKDLDKKQKIEDAANKGDKMAKLVRRYNALGPKALSPEELKMINKSSPKKMKKDSAMKLKKESPVKKDNDKDRSSFKDGITRDKDGKIISYSGEAAIKRMAQLEMNVNPGMTMEEAMKIARKNMAKSKSATKMGHKSATKLKKPSPAKQKMNMVKGPDGKMVPDFAVDGKGANDMKSATKMKPGKTAIGPKRTKKEIKKTNKKFNKAVKKGKKKEDSAVKMVKRVDPKISKEKPEPKQMARPLPNKGRVTPKPTKQIKVAKMKPMKPMKPVKMPKVTARF
jgi:hypothetical protein